VQIPALLTTHVSEKYQSWCAALGSRASHYRPTAVLQASHIDASMQTSTGRSGRRSIAAGQLGVFSGDFGVAAGRHPHDAGRIAPDGPSVPTPDPGPETRR
jgi:hypothetical protein